MSDGYRKYHDYPLYTFSTEKDKDYFTIYYADHFTVLENKKAIIEYRVENLSGAVYLDGVVYFTKWNENVIYSYREDGVTTVAYFRDYSSVRVIKCVLQHGKRWLVFENDSFKSNFIQSSHIMSSSLTATYIYDLERKCVLFEVPMPFLIDMGIAEDGIGVLLGEGVEGETYEEDGDGPCEKFLISIEMDEDSGKVTEIDSLMIVSIYNAREGTIVSKETAGKEMKFPLFNSYLYHWLETKSLSAFSNYVVYYSEDINGIIISRYQDGKVYRLFHLPVEYKKGMQFYFNEATNVFSILYNGNVEQYLITLRSTEKLEGLNDYYEKNKGRDLSRDHAFKNLLYYVLFNTKCERTSDLMYNHDVAISFAGKDREFADRLAHLLKLRQVRVFYDNDYRSDLWGADLPEALDMIYRNQSKFCIVICSENYPESKWAILESKSYKAAQFETGRYDYILPVLLDDTKIPGILSTQGYLDARKMSQEEIVEAFIQKLVRFDRQGV